MERLSYLKTAVRNGDTEKVRELSKELSDDGVYFGDALILARNLNKTKARRGQWQDIVDLLEMYFE